MSAVPDVHALLHWANRSEVAREITRRGYRVSVETLNRWHRDRKELPAVVERIVFELFGAGHGENAPAWAEALEARLTGELIRNRELIEALAPTDIREAAARVIARLEALGPPGDEAPDGTGGGEDQDAAAPPVPGPGSHRGRVVG